MKFKFTGREKLIQEMFLRIEGGRSLEGGDVESNKKKLGLRSETSESFGCTLRVGRFLGISYVCQLNCV